MFPSLAPVPTHEEFFEECRRAFAFLAEHGFHEVPPPTHRQGKRLLFWYRAGARSITISGEGWGQFAQCHLEHGSGVRAAPSSYIPAELRSKPRKRRKKGPGDGQLAEIRRASELVKNFCAEFLAGDLERFFRLAGPLPAYLLAPEQRH